MATGEAKNLCDRGLLTSQVKPETSGRPRSEEQHLRLPFDKEVGDCFDCFDAGPRPKQGKGTLRPPWAREERDSWTVFEFR